jgi:hypothetical protein
MVGNGGGMIDLGDILMRSPPLPTLHELKVYFINDLSMLSPYGDLLWFDTSMLEIFPPVTRLKIFRTSRELLKNAEPLVGTENSLKLLWRIWR